MDQGQKWQIHANKSTNGIQIIKTGESLGYLNHKDIEHHDIWVIGSIGWQTQATVDKTESLLMKKVVAAWWSNSQCLQPNDLLGSKLGSGMVISVAHEAGLKHLGLLEAR
jgi:hypothetical protein